MPRNDHRADTATSNDALPMPTDRTCPRCGRTTAEPICPDDATPTLAALDAPTPWTEGMVIDGRYRLEQRVGRGGHGTVFRASQVLTGQQVALKLLLPTEDPLHIRRFLREADILARLRSPHTVRILDRGPAGYGSLYLAMTWLEGQSLEARLGGNATPVLTQRQAIDVGIQVLHSLEEAHQFGLVHRDLKPGNVMVHSANDAWKVTVVDFGIAQVRDHTGDTPAPRGLERMTATGTVLGTPTCMSPEQCLGEPLDGRSDLYALGVLLYRCVAGEIPFDDPNGFTVMYNHVHVPPRDLATTAKTPVTLGFVEIVLRALAKQPAQRFATARAMREALQRLDTGDDQPALPARLAPTGRQRPVMATQVPVASQPARRGVPVAVAVLALVLAAWLAWSVKPEPATARAPAALAPALAPVAAAPPVVAIEPAAAPAELAEGSARPSAPTPATPDIRAADAPAVAATTRHKARTQRSPPPRRRGVNASHEDPASTLPPD